MPGIKNAPAGRATYTNANGTRAAGETRPCHKKEPRAVYACLGFPKFLRDLLSDIVAWINDYIILGRELGFRNEVELRPCFFDSRSGSIYLSFLSVRSLVQTPHQERHRIARRVVASGAVGGGNRVRVTLAPGGYSENNANSSLKLCFRGIDFHEVELLTVGRCVMRISVTSSGIQ
jgi:hypothetical protein